ncbi:hypothetical protein NDN08_000433 [Rhodosorus marinus]|uniref:Uncharacterized protein n=1 Tax=Rhodosorus marinus TaxID=101924 RepID=A0AAV8URI9_9RHOD|nr:hypothetical protein NDN08_000433 [Rhodosorus marinus]
MATSSERRIPNDGLEMKDFFPVGRGVGVRGPVAEVNPGERDLGRGATYHIETYGCQMNVADSELVRSILNDRGFSEVQDRDTANILMVNTCSIRDKAERKVLSKLSSFRKQKLRLRKDRRPIVCVLGCMAERLKTKLLEEMLLADVVVGPDAYRDLPRLLSIVRDGDSGAKAYNVQLSLDETYADLRPVRTSGNGVSAFVSIMRGCANMCTYCIVPFTRGRERSRPLESIVDEITGLVEAGYKEVVLLGQNVNSYNDISSGQSNMSMTYAPGFKTVYRPPKSGRTFSDLVDAVCRISKDLRVRYTSPHPKDFPQDLIELYKTHRNLPRHIHLPLQSGSDEILERMRRGYTRKAFLELVMQMRSALPDLALSTDIITGFCGESESDHEDTMRLVKQVEFESAFVFAYSQREKTFAARHLEDDVPHETKIRRLQEIGEAWKDTAFSRNSKRVGTVQRVLVEGKSDLKDGSLTGRSEFNTRAFFHSDPSDPEIRPGQFVNVQVDRATTTTLFGQPVGA